MTDAAKNLTRDAAPAGPVRTPNPWCVVARTARVVRFPLGLIHADTLAKGADGKHEWRGIAVVHLDPGVNFLACLAPSYEYVERIPTTPVDTEPPAATLRTVILREGPGAPFVADFIRSDMSVDVAGLEAALLRAFRWLADLANTPSGGTGVLYVPDRGHDVPDLTLVRVNDLLAARGEDPAKMSRLSVLVGRLCAYHRNEKQLGALHDYAMRHGSIAAHITEACRARRRAFVQG